MRAEAAAIGGSLRLDAVEPHGTRIRLEWPSPTRG
jgi:signal transduction histidine kinase